ncbi:protein DEHYDRATION-INDUCED 19 homolog 2-like [Dioscorea cayenensis subsp. rotundata]|uniref:Protein DEHYDRATION-INDUCED 19 homolog 2-like n=1 Tax=Dioscorea cayennensis subsp. rotundata TaxID=55577 RepID=A0AB40D1G4_DIOCR|nr:protein DEHYDRATION-INDUCED 19 homolog 2-like [Dioscorea cayenensis subsp. rotundata]
MEADSWTRFSAKHQQSAVLQSRHDLYLGLDEIDGGGDDGAEFPCPFCSEDFDIVGLCCHIDEEHPVEANTGDCPLCMTRVGMDLVGHITMQHRSVFKSQQRRRIRKGSSGSHSAIPFLRKEIRQGNLQPLFGGSSFAASSNAAPNPLLLSFILNVPVADSTKDLQIESSDEGTVMDEGSVEKVVESAEPSLSDKDQQERAFRSNFVQELVLSTIFEDIL